MQKCDVKKLELEEFARHQDFAVALEFWKDLETYLERRSCMNYLQLKKKLRDCERRPGTIVEVKPKLLTLVEVSQTDAEKAKAIHDTPNVSTATHPQHAFSNLQDQLYVTNNLGVQQKSDGSVKDNASPKPGSDDWIEYSQYKSEAWNQEVAGSKQLPALTDKAEANEILDSNVSEKSAFDANWSGSSWNYDYSQQQSFTGSTAPNYREMTKDQLKVIFGDETPLETLYKAFGTDYSQMTRDQLMIIGKKATLLELDKGKISGQIAFHGINYVTKMATGLQQSGLPKDIILMAFQETGVAQLVRALKQKQDEAALAAASSDPVTQIEEVDVDNMEDQPDDILDQYTATGKRRREGRKSRTSSKKLLPKKDVEVDMDEI